jgi:ABC-type polysaccharide transport system permease subunit
MSVAAEVDGQDRYDRMWVTIGVRGVLIVMLVVDAGHRANLKVHGA